MKALITSAGKGTRLEHLTHTTNKGLIKIGEKSLLDHAISALNKYGIEEIYVITGHCSLDIEKHVEGRATCIFNPFFAVSGIIASIWFAKEYLKGCEFIFTTCDHFFHPDLLPQVINAKGDIPVLIQKKACDREDAKVILSNGKIKAMGKDLPLEEASGELTGLIKIRESVSADFFNEIELFLKNGNLNAYVMDILMSLQRKGSPLLPVFTNDLPRIEVDYKKDLEVAMEMYKKNWN